MRALVLTTFAVVVLLSSTGVTYAITPLPLTGSQWAIINLSVSSKGATRVMTTHADSFSGGVQFPFLDSTASPAGFTAIMTNGRTASLLTSNVLTAAFDTVQTSGPLVRFVGNPNGGCPGSSSSLCPGEVRLYFQSVLPATSVPTCNGHGFNEYNYWWSNNGKAGFPGNTATEGAGYYQFTVGGSGGTVTLSVSLDPSNWSDLCGHSGIFNSAATAGFMSALAKIKEIGLSFGSGFFFSNGVGVDYTTGTADFQLTGYSIS